MRRPAMRSKNWGTGSSTMLRHIPLRAALAGILLLVAASPLGLSPAFAQTIPWESPEAFFPVEVLAWDPSVTPEDIQITSASRRPNSGFFDVHSSPNWLLGLGEKERWARRMVAQDNTRHLFEMRDAWVVPAPGSLVASIPDFPKATLSFGYCVFKDALLGGASKPLQAFLEWRMMGDGPAKRLPLPLPRDLGCKSYTEFSAPVPTGAKGFAVVVQADSPGDLRDAFVVATPAISVRVEGPKDAQGALTALLGSVAGPNLVLFFIDAARGDCVGPGNTKFPSVTPKLDAWYKQGVGFDKAFSPSNQTRPSIVATLQGQPPTVGSFYTRSMSMPAKTLKAYRASNPPLLPLLLKLAGYRTASIGRNHFQFENTGFGIDPGFAAVWDTRAAAEDTDEIVTEAIRWTKAHAHEKFLLLVNIPAPHQPYNAPPEFEQQIKKLLGKKPLGLLKNYLAEVLYSDFEVDRFLKAMEELDLMKRTVVVITADHGEAMSKHHICHKDATAPDGLRCQYGHGTTLYDEELHVPMLMLMPPFAGLSKGVRKRPVSQLDLTPTLLQLAGLGPHPRHVGESLLPDLKGEELPERPVYSEARAGAAMRLGRYKYILRHPKEVAEASEKAPGHPKSGSTTDKPQPQASRPGAALFDVVMDPGEERDEGGRLPLIRDQWREFMKSLREGFAKKVGEGKKLPWKPLPHWTPRTTPLSRPAIP